MLCTECLVADCNAPRVDANVPFCRQHFDQLDARDRRRVRQGFRVAIEDCRRAFEQHR